MSLAGRFDMMLTDCLMGRNWWGPTEFSFQPDASARRIAGGLTLGDENLVLYKACLHPDSVGVVPPLREIVQLSGGDRRPGEKKWPPHVLANRT